MPLMRGELPKGHRTRTVAWAAEPDIWRARLCKERGKLDGTVVGIDISKDNFPPAGGTRRAPLDIAVVPRKDVFSPSRDAAGLDALIARLVPLAPKAVAVEATGGFETVVAASLAAAGGAAVVSGCGGLPVVVVNPAEVRASRPGLGQARQDRSDRCH